MLLVTGGCLLVAVWGIDFKDVKDSFAQANYATLPVLLALLFLYFWLKAIRWQLLLHPLHEFRTKQVFGPLMIGFMGNNVLPAHLGELFRVYVLARKYRLSKTAVFSTVVLERILDLAAILGFLFVSLMFVETGLPEDYQIYSRYIAGLTVFGIVVVAVYVFWTAWFVAETCN